MNYVYMTSWASAKFCKNQYSHLSINLVRDVQPILGIKDVQVKSLVVYDFLYQNGKYQAFLYTAGGNLYWNYLASVFLFL